MPERLGTFFKTAVERKRYSIFYGDWLDAGELISSATFTVTPAPVLPADLEVDASSISSDGQTLVFFVNSGVDQADYTILAEAVSSGGQTKEDELVVLVRDF